MFKLIFFHIFSNLVWKFRVLPSLELLVQKRKVYMRECVIVSLYVCGWVCLWERETGTENETWRLSPAHRGALAEAHHQPSGAGSCYFGLFTPLQFHCLPGCFSRAVSLFLLRTFALPFAWNPFSPIATWLTFFCSLPRYHLARFPSHPYNVLSPPITVYLLLSVVHPVEVRACWLRKVLKRERRPKELMQLHQCHTVSV